MTQLRIVGGQEQHFTNKERPKLRGVVSHYEANERRLAADAEQIRKRFGVLMEPEQLNEARFELSSGGDITFTVIGNIVSITIPGLRSGSVNLQEASKLHHFFLNLNAKSERVLQEAIEETRDVRNLKDDIAPEQYVFRKLIASL